MPSNRRRAMPRLPEKVVFLTNNFPPRLGGMAVHAWELSKSLAARLNVVVITAAGLIEDGGRFYLPHAEKRQSVLVSQSGAIGAFRRPQIRLCQALQILNEVRRRDRVVVHVHELKPHRWIRRLFSGPIVWTNHSSMFLERFASDHFPAWLSENLGVYDFVTAPSIELYERTWQVGFPQKRAVYIPNGVDAARFFPQERSSQKSSPLGDRPERPLVFLTMRRFVRKNGLHVLLDAIARLPPSVSSRCQFLFAGSDPEPIDPYAREIVSRVRALDDQGSATCRLLGVVDQEKAPAIYRSADVFLLPSLVEATSIAGLEAMASALPVVASDVGGIPEIVEHDRTGLLSPPGDSNALARNIEVIASNPELRKEYGREGRRRVLAQFNWPRVADRFLEVYSEALEYRSAKGWGR